MTRRSWMAFAAMFVAALFLVGCSSDGDTGMAGPAGPPGEPPSEDEIAAVVEEVVEGTETDTSELEETITALEEQIAELTAEDPTIPEILGGMKDSTGAADLAAASKKVAGELNARYDDNNDDGVVDLPEIDETIPVMDDATTGDLVYAEQLDLDSDGESQFLKDSDIGVDLSSAGDIGTLKLGNLLTVDGVTLQKVTLSETDKVTVEKNGSFTVDTGAFEGDTVGNFTQTTTYGNDGSTTRVVTNQLTGEDALTVTTIFVGGMQIVENAPAIGNTIAMVTRADGRVITYLTTATDDYAGPDPTEDVDRGAVPGLLADAMADYGTLADGNGAPVAIKQDSAVGYGAWLADSFFLAYTLMSEDDTKRDDPDSMAYKSVFGGRNNKSAMAMDLSGRGSTAMWKGLMVGHDMDKDEATYGNMVKGNASITAQLAPATLADQTGSASGGVSLVDVALTNIINDKGEDARVTELMWTNLDLVGAAPGLDGQDDGGDPMAMAVSFSKGSEITGNFYDDGNEVVGKFNKEDIAGVFGAVEYEMMDDMADSQ